MLWFDMMAIPKDAPHPANALRIHQLHPASRGHRRRSATRSPTPIRICRRRKLVNEAIRNDPNVYPPAEVRARLFFDKPVTPQFERLRTRAWTRVKTGS